ncbi:13096_t:CDS:1, partial [Gigaspora rosea]
QYIRGLSHSWCQSLIFHNVKDSEEQCRKTEVLKLMKTSLL